MQEYLSFLYMIIAVIVADLALSGDNSIIIAMVVKKLPKEQQRLALIGGILGALIARIVFLFSASLFMALPYSRMIAGAMLIALVIKLSMESEVDDEVPAASTLMSAMFAIAIADISMSLDNVVAIAGIADGDFTIMVIGIVMSIILMTACSGFIIKMMDKYPWIAKYGSFIIALAGIKIFFEDSFIQSLLQESTIWYSKIFLDLLAMIFLKIEPFNLKLKFKSNSSAKVD